MSTYTYRNTSTQTLTIAGVGVIEPGKTATVSQVVENPNLVLVEDGDAKKPKQETK